MPYKSENIKLTNLNDRRRKLTDEQIAEAKKIRETTGAGWRTIAKQFGVSKESIKRWCDDAARQRHHEYNARKWRTYKYSKEERARVMREHRRYKQKLFIEGKIGTVFKEGDK